MMWRDQLAEFHPGTEKAHWMFLQHAVRLFRTYFCVQADDKDLLRAQFKAFQKQVPLLYVILSVNTVALAYSFRMDAPAVLSVVVPSVMSLVCAVRVMVWIYRRRNSVSDEQILQRLRSTNKLSVFISIAFCAWALSLYCYGDAYMRGHVAFYMALTEIAVIFCLMHLRSAALITAIIVMVPFCAFFFMTGIPSFAAIAVNLALVCCAMMLILFVSYRDFANLVETRRSLIAKQRETQRLSDENFRIANLDSLTDLPNRRSFFADLDACTVEARQLKSAFAIGIIDLDGFKPVNDKYGHAVGDALLVEVGRRLRELRSPTVGFARLGGDEFTVLIREARSDQEIREFGRQLCEAIRLPYQIAASVIQISCSIGFARFSEPRLSLEMLYERADYALYCAKRYAKGSAIVFSPEHETEIQTSRVIEQALAQADLDAELSLLFQPIISAVDGQPVGFEALARWNSPRLGVVSPGEFIPTAERMGIVSGLTKVLLGKALAIAKTWPEMIRLSFNLSAHDICSAEATLNIIALVNRSGIDPRRIDFEVTETAVAYDFSQALSTVVALRALGCGISLDDFGTGFSSLSHLHRLPLDKVKVDRSFVDEITRNPVSHKIVKSLMALCADMGLKCIIEGVETVEQEALLLRMGCDYMQGYYYGRPMTAEQAAGLIAERFGAFQVAIC